MASTFTLLQKITVNTAAGAASVTFSNIPQTYTDLKIIFCVRSLRSAANADGLDISFNGLTTGFNARWFESNGSAASVGADTRFTGDIPAASATANIFSSTELYIPGYASSTTSKQVQTDSVAENNSSTAYMNFTANSWNSTAAITSMGFASHNGNISQYSTFYLYGISSVASTSAAQPKATGGDIVTYDGTYWYHAFLTSGTFTPKATLSCDYLVVAGGGAGGGVLAGGSDGGGGGAGGVSYLASASTPAFSLPVLVGAAGTAGTTVGGNGTNSSIRDIISIGGGGGGGNGAAAAAGGSGGGGGANHAAGGAATQGSSGGATGYGNAGGTSSGSVYNISGGGGAGAVGVSAFAASPPVTQGNGGAGLNTWSTWLSATGLGVSGYIAGGGGAGKDSAVGGTVGSGGAGGGGAGGIGGSTNATAGTSNTGGGGGGAGGSTGTNSANGGSGLIIVRYAG